MQAPESTHLEWYSGSTSACHAEDRGSIPRSRDLLHFCHSSSLICLLAQGIVPSLINSG